MGVSGCGKSTVGGLLAARLGVPFVDGDSMHPAANIEKMASGHPLDDDDRWPWLRAVGLRLAESADGGIVLACSALKRAYRDLIVSLSPGTVFVHLDAPRELLASRLESRGDHFMPSTLLASQLDALEPLAGDEPGFVLDAGQYPRALAMEAEVALLAGHSGASRPDFS
jgi:carbohydrate kinase (thermoresistant glucokinase family)